MTDVESNLRGHRWRLYQWPLLCLLTTVAIILGLVGFERLASAESWSLLDRIYATLQLFVLGAQIQGPISWELQVARFLAPAVTVYTATQALLVIFREHVRLLKLQFRKRHVVVCGLGRTGFKVAADFLRKGDQVVVIEEESENDWIGTCEKLGGLVLIGDAADEMLLRQARVDHARLLVVVCGNDGINVEVAILGCELKRHASQAGTPTLACHVHIVDEDLRAVFKQHRVFTDTGDRFKVQLFNIYDTSARQLLQEHPLDRVRIDADDSRTAHLVVIGLGQMGESVVLQAAQIGHYANGKRLRITVIDQEADVRKRSFYRRNPQFDTVCDISFLNLGGDDPQLFKVVKECCAKPDTLASVVVCFDDDARCLSFALALLPGVKALRVPILIRTATDGGLTALLDAEMASTQLGGLVRPFPVLALWSNRGMFLQPEMDALAVAIHEQYVNARTKSGVLPGTDPSLRAWDELDEDLKDSNRHQADHIPVKLRALGLSVGPVGRAEPVTQFAPSEVELLARVEHVRWNAERFLAGWSHAPGSKSIENKTSPYLVDWEALPESIKEYDREAVRNIPNLVNRNGQQILRSAD